MKTVSIKKEEFLKDREKMTVIELMKKYSLNTSQYYSVLDQLGIERKKMSERKKIQVV